MSQLALLEALTEEIWDAIDRYGDALPVASVLGVLEVVKFEMLTGVSNEEDDE